MSGIFAKEWARGTSGVGGSKDQRTSYVGGFKTRAAARPRLWPNLEGDDPATAGTPRVLDRSQSLQLGIPRQKLRIRR